MIITCPHCQTKYQVTYETIGSVGRKVQCAHCHREWNQDAQAERVRKTGLDPQTAEDDRLFDAMAEDALDDAMAAEEKAVAGQNGGAGSPVKPLPYVDAAELQKRQVAFKRRQNAMISSLPMARLRRAARVAGVVILAGIVGGAWFARVPIVERFPDLAGLYEAVGLGVNIVGLDFSNLETLRALSGGNDVLSVSAQIVGRSPTPVAVPPVVISLLDTSGQAVFEWSVAPRVRDLMAGERATFDTRLSLPPSEAVTVRLSFAGSGASPGERGADVGTPPALPQPSMVDALSLENGQDHAPADSSAHAEPGHDPHAAPAAATDDHAAEPGHDPAPAAQDHH
jgi:predicted Zn finger-like uncharacterized protein